MNSCFCCRPPLGGCGLKCPPYLAIRRGSLPQLAGAQCVIAAAAHVSGVGGKKAVIDAAFAIPLFDQIILDVIMAHATSLQGSSHSLAIRRRMLFATAVLAV